MTSSTKHQPLSKPYLERANHYAETRARIFNDTSDPSSNTLLTNKNSKMNSKQHSNFIRPSYRKQQQQQQQQHQNSSHQHRSYTYQQTTNNHMQQYPTGKTIDPSSHMLNTSTTRSND
jgi:SRSO17 transposase